MNDNIGYKFIQYPYNCEYGSSANVLIEHTIMDKDVTLEELLGTFEHFLRAAGFHIQGRVDIINDEEELNVDPADLTACWTGPYYSSDPDFLKAISKSQKHPAPYQPDAGFELQNKKES